MAKSDKCTFNFYNLWSISLFFFLLRVAFSVVCLWRCPVATHSFRRRTDNNNRDLHICTCSWRAQIRGCCLWVTDIPTIAYYQWMKWTLIISSHIQWSLFNNHHNLHRITFVMRSSTGFWFLPNDDNVCPKHNLFISCRPSSPFHLHLILSLRNEWPAGEGKTNWN